jgi:two-component system cell cycle sensor histidine kinase/response regulator CckA
MFTAVLDALPFPLVLLDQNGKIVFVNSRWREKSGLLQTETPDTWVGQHYLSIFQSSIEKHADIQMIDAAIQNALKGESTVPPIEYPFHSKEGVRWFEMKPIPMSLQGQKYVLLAHSDITERMEYEKRLEEIESRLSDTLRITRMGTSTYFPETGVLEWSDETFRIMGFDPAKPAPTREEVFKRIHPDDNAIYQPRYQHAMATGESFEMDLRFASSATPKKWIRLVVIPKMNENNKVDHIFTLVMDISKRKSLEEKLLYARSLEKVGRLAGGIAHEFNNILTAIEGYTEIALSELSPFSSVRNHLQQINRAATRAAHLTSQLLSFARKQIMTCRALDLNDLILQMQPELTQMMGPRISLDLKLEKTPWRIKADPCQIQEVIREIASNSKDFMPNGGTLIIETSNIFVDLEYERLHPDLHQGNYVSLIISDNGEGMSLETQANVFDPYFSTGEFGIGHGFGLAASYGIIKQHEGYIWLYSEPGHGTTFKILFPRCQEPLVAQETADIKSSDTGMATILVLLEQDMLRDITVATLRNKGYTVLEAETCQTALNTIQKFQAPIKLMISDTLYATERATGLRDYILSKMPDIRILFLSSESNMSELGDISSRKALYLLDMPFSSHMLLQKVREVLDGAASYKEFQ